MLNFLEANKKILYLALPMILTSMVGAVTSILSMYLVSLLGSEALAAGAIISSTYSFLIMMTLSFLFPIGILIGQKYAMNKAEEIPKLFHQGFILATLLSIPLIIMMWKSYPILIFLRQSSQTSKLVEAYFQALSLGILPTLYCAAISQFFNGILKPKIMTMISIIALVAFAILGYGFVLGKFGNPKFGIAGIGYASAIVSWISFITLIIYLGMHKHYKIFQLFPLRFRFAWQGLSQVLQMGWPISIQYGAEILAFTFMTYLIGTLGSVALGAQQIMLQCAMVGIMVMLGLSQATSILIGQMYRKKEFAYLKPIFHASLFLVFVFMGVNGLVYCLYPQSLIGIFLDIHDTQAQPTLQLATALLAILAVTQIFDGVRHVTTGALRGYHDMRFSMVMGIVSCWVIAVPFCILLMLKWGAVGVRIGFLIGIAVGAMVLVQRFYKITTNL